MPYHGLVVNNELKISNGQVIQYPSLKTGDTQLVAIPNQPQISRSLQQQEFDRIHGLEWRNYAIVSDNHLGAAYLGLDWLLYIDHNQVVWYLKLGFEISGKECLMNCRLDTVFGRFNNCFPLVSRILVQAKTTFAGSGKLKRLNRFTFERIPNGSEVYIHIYAKLDGENSIDFPEEMTLYEVWKLELKGEGTLTTDQKLGEGISATLYKYKSFSELNVVQNKKVPRVENKFRVGKVNINYQYAPKPVEAPECATTICCSTFKLQLVPDGADFTPFKLDGNTYIQSNWHGEVETKTFVVRILYDVDGEPHEMSVQRVNKRLNRLYQNFEGYGSGTQGPIEYYFNGFMCLVNGMLPGWVEIYEGTQYVESQFLVRHEAIVLNNQKPIKTLALQAETSQTAVTEIGAPVINNVNVKVKLNDVLVRNVDGKPGVLSNSIITDPFSNSFRNDHKHGIFAKFYFGLVSNHLIGQFVTRHETSSSQNILTLESHSVVGAKIINPEVIRHPLQFYLAASFNPISGEVARYQKGVQCWV